MTKFRLWNKRDKCWEPTTLLGVDADGKLSLLLSNGYDNLSDNEVVIVEWTGAKDRNGKDIFEGDIVETVIQDTGSPTNCWRTFVEWNESDFQWQIFDYTGISPELERYVDTKGYGYAHYPCEVIGNVFENSKLAKELGYKERNEKA